MSCYDPRDTIDKLAGVMHDQYMFEFHREDGGAWKGVDEGPIKESWRSIAFAAFAQISRAPHVQTVLDPNTYKMIVRVNGRPVMVVNPEAVEHVTVIECDAFTQYLSAKPPAEEEKMSRKSVEEIYAEVKAESEARRAAPAETCVNCKHWQGDRNDELDRGRCAPLVKVLRYWDSEHSYHPNGTYETPPDFGCNKWEVE